MVTLFYSKKWVIKQPLRIEIEGETKVKHGETGVVIKQPLRIEMNTKDPSGETSAKL